MTTSTTERTAWVAVATRLRRDVVNGVVGVQGMLDTEAELCRRFGASRITIRRALQQLRDEGLVTSQRGSGWRVLFTAQARSLRIGGGERIDTASPRIHRENHRWRTARASSEVRDVISRLVGQRAVTTEPGLQWTYQQRANGALFDLVKVWFSPLTAPLVIRAEQEKRALTKSLENSGVVLGGTIQNVRADLPTDNEQALFDNTHCAVLVLERLTRTASSDLACVSIHRHRGNYVHVPVDLPLSHINDGRVFGVSSIR